MRQLVTFQIRAIAFLDGIEADLMELVLSRMGSSGLFPACVHCLSWGLSWALRGGPWGLLDSMWPLNLKDLQNELPFLSSSTEAMRDGGHDIGIKCDLGPDTEPSPPVTEKK